MVYREIALFLTYNFPTRAIQAIQHDGLVKKVIIIMNTLTTPNSCATKAKRRLVDRAPRVARLDDRIEWISEYGSYCSQADMRLKQSSVKVNATLVPRTHGALL